MFYKLNKVHLRQGIGREHLAMCGVGIKHAKPFGNKVTCKNCMRIVRYMVKYNSFYEHFLYVKKAYIMDVSVWYPCWKTHPKLRLDLSDGRTIVVPINWYPKLEKATLEQRSNWKLIDRGEGIHWPDLDENISLQNILDGKPSTECKKTEKKKDRRNASEEVEWTQILEEKKSDICQACACHSCDPPRAGDQCDIDPNRCNTCGPYLKNWSLHRCQGMSKR